MGMETIAFKEFTASYDQLESIRAFVKENALILGISSDVCYNLVFSVTEVATNVIEHGYKEMGGGIEIELCRQGNDFIVKIKDDAPLYDLNAIPEPDLSLPLNKMPLGGLGVFMTKSLVDSYAHRSIENGGNEIVLVKQDVIQTEVR